MLESQPLAPLKVTLFGGRAFTEVIKLERGRRGRFYSNMTGVFTKRGNVEADKPTGRTPCEDKGGHQGHASRSQRENAEDC